MAFSKQPEKIDIAQIRFEYDKINSCINKSLPLVLTLLESAFSDNNIDYTLTGRGLDMKFELKKNKFGSSMFLRNLLLEIATVDRDNEPLHYDYRLDDMEFLFRRILEIVSSKLRVLLPVMNGKDIKEIERYAPNYERLKIAKLDGKKLSDEFKKKIEKGFMP